jgi:hypothetical protein
VTLALIATTAFIKTSIKIIGNAMKSIYAKYNN